MRVFEELAANQHIQFVLATHSPHLSAASPAGALRAVIDGQVHPFATTPSRWTSWTRWAQFDRMEIIPLLKTKAVVFVENRDDRDYLQMFARKLWGEAKTNRVWEGLCFLFTYQEPIAANVKRLARQVKDLLNSGSLGGVAAGRQPRFLVIGDRDYRSAAKIKELRKGLEKAAGVSEFKLDLGCEVWKRNEIENYLLDPQAIEQAVVASLADPAQTAAARSVVQEAIASGLEQLKEQARIRIAHQLQHSDYTFRGDFTKTDRESRGIIEQEWGDGFALCDAKELLSLIRKSLQTHHLRARLTESAIVECMASVPADVRSVLRRLQQHSAATPRNRKQRKAPEGAKGGTA